jgi:hypothetical protein
VAAIVRINSILSDALLSFIDILFHFSLKVVIKLVVRANFMMDSQIVNGK